MEITGTGAGTGTIYDLENKTAIQATKEELTTLLQQMAQSTTAPENTTPMWKLLSEGTNPSEPWMAAHNLSTAEFPADGSDTCSGDDDGADEEEWKLDPETLTCEVCQTPFSSPERLELHMTEHMPTHACILCEEEFPTAEELDTHELTHSR